MGRIPTTDAPKPTEWHVLENPYYPNSCFSKYDIVERPIDYKHPTWWTWKVIKVTKTYSEAFKFLESMVE